MTKYQAAVKSVEEFFKRKNFVCDEMKAMINLCSKNVRELHVDLKRANSVEMKHHLQDIIAKMVKYRSVLKSMVVKRGGCIDKRPSKRVLWHELKNIFEGRIRSGVITNIKHKDPLKFLEDCGPLFTRRILNQLKTEPFLKINTEFCGKFIKPAKNENLSEFKYLKTKNIVVSRDDHLVEWFSLNVMIPLMERLEEFQERDSGWALSEVINLTINVNKYTPQLGSSYVELPRKIKAKQACVNVKNNDQMCFMHAIVSSLYPVNNHSDRLTSYPHYSQVLNDNGITYPVTREQIPKFESLNNISVNVYVLNKKNNNFTVSPSRLASSKLNKHVNLLLIQDKYYDENLKQSEKLCEPISYHYVWIKDLSRLVSGQLNKHKGKNYFCDRCLHYFYSQDKLQLHSEYCQTTNNYRIILNGGKVSFKNFNHKEKCPFIIYADIESLLRPISKQFGAKGEKFQHHEAYSVGYYFKCSYDDSLSYYRSYRGLNCAKWFSEQLKQLAEDMSTVFLCPIPMNSLTPGEEQEFREATHCHICEKPLKNIRVKDHCHLTGKFRGAAHEDCNLNYQDSHTVPVVFHNLSGYDAHFVLKDIAENIEGSTKLIPNNNENFISIIKNVSDSDIKYKFIDSFRFMASSLNKLSSYLDVKSIIQKEFAECDKEAIKLLTTKGVLPYDYINSWAKLNETKLPPIKSFYSSLNDSEISQEDFNHALNVWDTFGCQSLGEYSDLYLKTDVLLLADVFEQFRNVCLKYYGLDAAYYYTAPGLTWDAMLKMTRVELDLIEDVDILMFLERGIRGGLTQCSKRHAKANNKYMKDFNAAIPSKFLMYYDINAMYSWAMSQYLPTGGLKWVEKNVESFDFNLPDDNPKGYILEVDIDYPESIHDRQSDLPMAPSQGSPPGSKQTKMLATLYKKQNYIVHYRNLKQYVTEGLIVTKIHRVLEFKQSPWLKMYINLNAELRKTAKNEFEKNFFKLMCNAVFGKTMENVRNRRDIRLTTKWEGRYGAEALISKPNFYSRSIVDDNLLLVELLKTEVLFNKPIYVGLCILDISKTALYEFHYSYMKNKYGDQCKLCYTDTDSLIYEIKTEDVYRDMKENIHRFDTSEYSPENIYGIPLVNKKVPGLMKDENNGRILEEFVGLRAKMYACRVPDDSKNPETKKAKGVKSYVIKKNITFDDYLRCLNENIELVHIQNGIRSFNHQVYSVAQEKISLSPHDDKRFLLPGCHDTLPWGHYSIMNIN